MGLFEPKMNETFREFFERRTGVTWPHRPQDDPVVAFRRLADMVADWCDMVGDRVEKPAILPPISGDLWLEIKRIGEMVDRLIVHSVKNDSHSPIIMDDADPRFGSGYRGP